MFNKINIFSKILNLFKFKNKKIIQELDLNEYLSSTIYDLFPHRLKPDDIPVSDRTIPVVFCCNKCSYKITFKTDDFEKHSYHQYSNLNSSDIILVNKYVNKNKLRFDSFLDFYCPGCNQAITITYNGGPSGYSGFYFKIQNLLVLNYNIQK